MRKAVITGDIINSTSLENEVFVNLMSELERFIFEMKKDHDIIGELYRGDSLQILVGNPNETLKIALLLKTFVKGIALSQQLKPTISEEQNTYNKPIFDIRIAIGIGEVDYIKEKLSISQGEAFQISGRLLDSMKNKQTIAIRTNDQHSVFLETSMMLLDWQMNNSTQTQNEVMYYKLKGHAEVQIAKIIGVNQSYVNQRLNTLGWPVVNEFIQKFEKTYA